ncbi:MAG: hypothetical protein H6891_05105 [Brucellaceae bacterium]|nr:hypothetical protein [Brucellaceae bacterium]
MRDAMNAALLAENDANRNIIGLATGAFLAAAVLLLLILPIAMMRRLRKGQAAAPALAGSTVPLSAHRRSDRVKLGFLANLDTEVRTSVSGVTAMAELLARTELDDQQRGCVDVIAKSGQALFELTSGALDYARADSELLQLEPAPFALRETVEAVADAMAPAASAKQLELAMRVMRDLPDGYIGDAPRVRQILSALVSLAIETSGTGTIVLDISGVMGANATASLALRVRADGAQMDKDALKHILDPLAEDDAEINPLSPATRLRLGLAGRLVKLMNGKLTGEALGDGAIALTATLGIPMDQAKRDANELTASLGTGRRLLVIDDNKVTRDALTEMARTIGFEAAGAEDGRLGGLFANHMAGMEKPLDLILIDSELREQSGLQIAADLQADEQVRGTALVLMTAPGAEVSATTFATTGWLPRWQSRSVRCAWRRPSARHSKRRPPGTRSRSRRRPARSRTPPPGATIFRSRNWPEWSAWPLPTPTSRRSTTKISACRCWSPRTTRSTSSSSRRSSRASTCASASPSTDVTRSRTSRRTART